LEYGESNLLNRTSSYEIVYLAFAAAFVEYSGAIVAITRDTHDV